MRFLAIAAINYTANVGITPTLGKLAAAVTLRFTCRRLIPTIATEVTHTFKVTGPIGNAVHAVRT